MSGETIRSVVIKIAIEQKQATLKVPDTSAVTAAVAQMSAAATKGTQSVVAAAQMQATAVEQARNAEADANKRVAATQSAVLSAYGASAMAALQMAKGVAFVVAANDEQAESFVRAIAKAQGYFDLAVGGIHVVKSLGDIQRQTAILTELQALAATHAAVAQTAVATTAVPASVGLAAVATTSGAATAGLAGVAVAGGTAAAVLAVIAAPLVIVAGVLAVAVVAFKSWNSSVTREAKRAAEAVETSTKRQADALTRLASATRESVSVQGAVPGGATQSAIEGQIAQLQAARATLSAAARQMPAGIDETRAGQETSIKRKLALQAEGISLMQQEQQLQDQLIEGKKAEQSAAQQALRTAQETLITEENRNRSENARLGLMSRADQNTAKRLLEKKGRGEELSIRDARKAQSLGILAGDVEAAGVKEAGRLGLTGARERGGETRPLEQARRDLTTAQSSAGEAIKQLDDELKEAAKQQKELADKLVKTIANKFATTEALQRVIEGIEDVKKENDKKWFWQTAAK